MRSRSVFVFAISIITMMALSACSNGATQGDAPTPTVQGSGQIYLYGEAHGVKKILDKELELWGEYYNTQGMRHLFVEYPYYTAEFLNIWMQSDSNEILDAIYRGIYGRVICNKSDSVLNLLDYLIS